MNRSLTLLAILVFFIQLSAFAQVEVRFVAVSKQLVQVGEQFSIVFEVNADGSGFTAPNFGNLQVLSGPNPSSSSSVQYSNGKMQQSYSLSYTYYVAATAEGEVNIPGASITVGGNKYTSNELKIEIVKTSGNAQRATGDRTQAQNEMGVLQDDDVYLTATASKRNPYIGEQIIVTYLLYFKVNITNYKGLKTSATTGFWSKSLTDDQQQLTITKEYIDGVEYHIAELAKYAMFPQKSGKLTIEPAETECVAVIQGKQDRRRSNSPFDDFFSPFSNRNLRNVEVSLKSKPITINVKSLPTEGKPASFNGAVGEYSFSAEVDRNKLVTNDALTLKVNISGKGNLELAKVEPPAFPSDFETYDPKVSSNIKTSSSGVRGSKKFEYLVIPRAPGDFIIPAIEFSYFNPKDRKYHSYSSDAFNIEVAKGAQGSSGITYSSTAQEDIRYIGKDIRHIKAGPFQFNIASVYFFGSTMYYILVGLPILLLILFILVWKSTAKKRADTSGMKTRKANKVARTRLQKADKFKKEGNDKVFYEEIAQALWGYIGDKFSIPVASLSIDTVQATLSDQNVNETVIDNFVNTLNNIEFARFAPGDASGKMENIYNEALNAITQAEKELKQ